MTTSSTTSSRRAVLALGSNQGNRLVTLQGAVDALAETDGVEIAAVSGVFETDPVGGPEQPDYLNAVVVVTTTMSARELLGRAHEIEQRFGRVRAQHWGPRTLDVDIVAVGDELVDEPDLVVPHPRAAERAFVLLPWLDADADAALPGCGPVADLLSGLGTKGVRPRPDLSLHREPAP
jgi:2-amino-4-hydroxy-6-hydroxymethyldihydropteridine diphosphokinase